MDFYILEQLAIWIKHKIVKDISKTKGNFGKICKGLEMKTTNVRIKKKSIKKISEFILKKFKDKNDQ